jgi:hypothetical protein
MLITYVTLYYSPEQHQLPELFSLVVEVDNDDDDDDDDDDGNTYETTT